MKIAVLGASGIIGQHMRLCVPVGVEVIWTRLHADSIHEGLDLTDREATQRFLNCERPDVIVNLAGENRVDVVESAKDPRVEDLNIFAPSRLSMWCSGCSGAHIVQVSSQAVFGGKGGPYEDGSILEPVNAYGWHKAVAEDCIHTSGARYSIIRPSFVLGIRPMPAVGRANPLEQMLTDKNQRQVCDRFFSVSFARDVARRIWEIALGEPLMRAENFGIPLQMSRYSIALLCRARLPWSERDSVVIEQSRHADFVGLAPRPLDTTYAGTETPEAARDRIIEEIDWCAGELRDRQDIAVMQRARELSIFTGQPADKCSEKLLQGFGELHNAVTADFNEFMKRTGGQISAYQEFRDATLLDWYRTTEAYCWELSAYHVDRGFNYAGTCEGIIQRLRTYEMPETGQRPQRVLCLGDGIGDLTMAMCRAGFDGIYHDLGGSRTAAFAQFRFWMYGQPGETHHTTGWEPSFPDNWYDVIVSLDFLEHVTDVEAWVREIHTSLRPGGLFCAQNAFACGSGPDGAMPMHLAVNDRWEKDWDPLLTAVGFIQMSSNWYLKPV